MTDIKSGINPLFLREEDLRQGIELLYFAYRDFTAEPDAILAEYGFGRAHHRVIHFVGRNPRITVSELLAILKITKQSLSRVLGSWCAKNSSSSTKALRTAVKDCSNLRPRALLWNAACRNHSAAVSPMPIAMQAPRR